MLLLLALITGVVLAALTHHVLLHNHVVWILLGISGFCWGILSYVLLENMRGVWQPRWKGHLRQLGLASLASALGWMAWQSAYHDATRWQLPDTLAAPINVTVNGTIIGLPAIKTHGTEVTVAVPAKALSSSMTLSPLSSTPSSYQQVAVDGRYHDDIHLRLQWYQLTTVLLPGQRWHLQLKLRPLHGFQDPGSFDYVAWLLQQDIQAVGEVVSATPISAHPTYTWQTEIDLWRAKLRHMQVVNLPASPLVGILTALCLGDKSLVSVQVQQVFIRTGTAHLLAISGLHIGLVAGLVWLFAQRLWRLWPRLCLWLPAKTAGLWMGVTAAWGYALLAGLAVSTQRAAFMVSFAALGLGCQRQFAWPFIWVLTLAIVLMISPLSVTSSGLWLSFSAVLALSYLGLHPKKYVRRTEQAVMTKDINQSTCQSSSQRDREPFGTTGIIGTFYRFVADRYRYQLYPWLWLQIGLTLLLAPLMLALFHQVSLAAIPANLLAIPWIGTIIVPLVLVGTLLQPLWPWAGHALLLLSLHGLTWIWPILTWLAAVPYVTWTGGVSTLVALLLGLWATMWLLAPNAVPWRQLGFGLLLPAWLNPGVAPVWGSVNLTVLDVGQGLSAVIRTHDHTLVYDMGPGDPIGFNAGTAVVVPFLRNQGVRHIDRVVLSHGDNDHIAGLPAVYQSYGEIPVLTSAPARIRQVLQLENSYPIRQCLAGQHWRWDGVDFVIRYPDAGHLGLDNNSSCVLQISAAGKGLLLPGDIEALAEQTVVKLVSASTVLVVPHHGSAGAALPQFLMTIAPKYAIFATGYLNRFHFPRARVLESYQAMHSQMFNTAYDGAISVTISPEGRVLVKTYIPRA